MRGLVPLLLPLAIGCHRSPSSSPSPAPPAAAVVAPREHADHDDRAQAAPAADLQVLVNGKPAPAWTLDRLNATARVAVSNKNGNAREGWPLREVVRALVGSDARVVALASDDERVPIDAREWQDHSRTLLLRLSHRGEYKAQWLDSDGAGDEAFLKHIRRVEIAN